MESPQSKKRLALLQDLYFTENKPQELQPLDVALVSYLLLRQTEDHFISDSQDTLAARLGCGRGAVARSIKRLEKLGWIITSSHSDWNPTTKRKTRRMFQPVGLSVNVDKLPVRGPSTRPRLPSPEAKDLALKHTTYVKRPLNQKYRKLPKNWASHQEHAAQRLIDDVGTVEAAVELVNFAIAHPEHQAAAQHSLYRLSRRVQKIQRSMMDSQTAMESGTAAAPA